MRAPLRIRITEFLQRIGLPMPLLVCLLIVVMGAIVVARFYIKPRGQKLYEQATELASRQQWKDASEKAAAAANLEKDNFAATQLAVTAALHVGEPSLPELGDRLYEHSQSALDRLNALKADFLGKRWEAFNKKLSMLNTIERKNDAVVQLEALSLARQDQLQPAIDLAREEVKKHNTPQMQFILAELLMQTQPRPDAEIAALLAQVVRLDKADMFAALEMLRQLTPKAVRAAKLPPDLPEFVLLMPGMSTTDFLSALQIEQMRDPDKLNELAAQAIERGKTHPSPDVFRWLLAAGQIKKAKELYDATPAAQQSADYDDVKLAFALDRKDYDDVISILGSSKLFDPAQKALLMALASSGGGFSDAEQWWDAAFAEAQKDGSGMGTLKIARAAESVKRDAIQSRALLLAADTPAIRQFTRNEILETLGEEVKQKNTKAAEKLLTNYLEKNPDDPDLANNALYLSLLANNAPPDALKKLQALCAKYPERMEFQSTLALALLKQGRPSEAVNLLRSIAYSNSSVAIQAAALRAAGQMEEARNKAKQLDRDALLPEEKVLVQGL